jgi:hypothetical protein
MQGLSSQVHPLQQIPDLRQGDRTEGPTDLGQHDAFESDKSGACAEILATAGALERAAIGDGTFLDIRFLCKKTDNGA